LKYQNASITWAMKKIQTKQTWLHIFATEPITHPPSLNTHWISPMNFCTVGTKSFSSPLLHITWSLKHFSTSSLNRVVAKTSFTFFITCSPYLICQDHGGWQC
jgi:hypothetical protein